MGLTATFNLVQCALSTFSWKNNECGAENFKVVL